MCMTSRQSSVQVRISYLANNFIIIWIKYQKANLNTLVFPKTVGQQVMDQSGQSPVRANDMLLALVTWLTHIYILSVVVSLCKNIVEWVWQRQTAFEYFLCGLLYNKELPFVANVIVGDLLHDWNNIQQEGGVLCTSLISKCLIFFLPVLPKAPFFFTCTQPGIPYYSNTT